MKVGVRRLIALAVTLAGTTAVSACGGPAVRAQQARVPGEYLVTLAARDSVKAIVDRYGRFGIKSIQDLGQHIFLVTLTKDPGPAEMEQLRGANASIQAVQPNFVYGIR